MTEFRVGDVVRVVKVLVADDEDIIGKDFVVDSVDYSGVEVDNYGNEFMTNEQIKLIRRQGMKYELGQKFTNNTSCGDLEIVEVGNEFYHAKYHDGSVSHFTDRQLNDYGYVKVTKDSDTTTITLASGEKKTISVASAKELGLL